MKNIWKVVLTAMLPLFAVLVFLPGKAMATVNDFAIPSFQADYYLERDTAHRSRLRTVETISAQFPDFNQNHGIERAIPLSYDGHQVRLSVASVKDNAGRDLPYSIYESGGSMVLRIGDAGKYVHGSQTYVISYTAHDVTKNFDGHDEFFWDVNGTQWQQQFGDITARLHLSKDMAAVFDGQLRCFQGRAGSTENCNISGRGEDGGMVITAAATRQLGAGENVSLVTGFKPGTFAAYQKTFLEKYLGWMLAGWFALGGLLVIGAAIGMTIAWRKYGKDAPGRGTLVPEYLPPKDVSVLVAAQIIKKGGLAPSAQIMDLAVRHYLKVYEAESRTWWLSKKHSYELEITKPADRLTADEKQLLNLIFNGNTEPGRRITIDSLRYKLSDGITKLLKASRQTAEDAGYYTDRSKERCKYYKRGTLVAALGIVPASPLAIIAGLIIIVTAASMRPLSDKGAALRDHLNGLEYYMKLAEAVRLQKLQSPEGAQKVGVVDVHDPRQLVKLYEKLLPYAVLFRQEKEWAKQLAVLYQEQPSWYSGSAPGFNPVLFASSVSAFTTANTTAFSPPTSSSSSGFSGGGSSGGGGGGGGGGGW